jgi:predicted membrane channel-forming protein YqfA (hemolysin III family)
MLAYDYPLLGVLWSLVLLFMFVMVGFVVIYTFIDNFRRSDHSGTAKAGWALLIIVFLLLGALIYILSRPEMTQPPLRPAVTVGEQGLWRAVDNPPGLGWGGRALDATIMDEVGSTRK